MEVSYLGHGKPLTTDSALSVRGEALPMRLHRLWEEVLQVRSAEETPEKTHRFGLTALSRSFIFTPLSTCLLHCPFHRQLLPA